MNRSLGIVVFSNYSGLGNQSRRLTQMLKPEKILLVDSTSFSKNREQHPDWYDGFNGYVSQGFPSMSAVNKFLEGLTHMYIIENPLNWSLITEAKRRGIKTYIASNYEFCDNLNHPHYPLPDFFLMPSYWMNDEMKAKFGNERVTYLPPPVDPNEFTEVRELNMSRRGKVKFVHIIGTLAAEDRNGTKTLLEALKYTKSDFQLMIKSQHQLPEEYSVEDSRVFFQIGNEKDVQNLYRDFDAMILPRRFGGLCLPMCEALMSGLPVIMTDISPNNKILSSKWLVPSVKTGTIMTRTSIDLYSADPQSLAQQMDWFINQSMIENEKIEAFELGFNNFRPAALEESYNKLW